MRANVQSAAGITRSRAPLKGYSYQDISAKFEKQEQTHPHLGTYTSFHHSWTSFHLGRLQDMLFRRQANFCGLGPVSQLGR